MRFNSTQRHQQASLQLAAGVPLAVVSKRLGHSSIAVTADVYSHLLVSTEHAAANAAAALVPPASAGKAADTHRTPEDAPATKEENLP